MNIFLPNIEDPSIEHFDTLLQTDKLKIEKITSHGQTSSEWYDQDSDEWVVLLEGEATLLFEEDREIPLIKGEYIFIASGVRHKVIYTSSPTIWLAIHF